MKKNPKRIGLAIIGAGRVGLFRGEVAARHPQVDFIGLAEIKPERAKLVAGKVGADFVTADYRELLARPEVTAVIVSTDEHLHVEPILAAVERGLPLLIEKPLATRLDESARVLKAIKEAKVDAVVGYTQRFRRRWLAAKEKCRTGALTIDDTHSDIVLAVSKGQSEGYNPDPTRLVDFMGSYPPGDMALGELRGPMALETDSWLNRVALGLPTAAATVEEAHRNLMLTKALDLSAKRKAPVKLPLDPDDMKAAA